MNCVINGIFITGISKNQQLDLFHILAAILHLGNVKMMGKGSENCSVPVSMSDGASTRTQPSFIQCTDVEFSVLHSGCVK